MHAVLPEKYYLSHALELFSFVQSRCAHLLNAPHHDYLEAFFSLDNDAQCLLVRILTRKPTFIKQASLTYAEIDGHAEAQARLESLNLIAKPSASDWPMLAALLTKDELLTSLDAAGLRISPSSRKATILAFVLNNIEASSPALNATFSAYVVRCQQDVLDYLFFLFFGDLRNRFQKFAMRDLGVLKTRQSKGTSVARFTNKAEAISAFEMQCCRRDFNAAPAQKPLDTASYLMAYNPVGQSAKETRDKLLLSIGEQLVEESPERALELWQHSTQPKAIERWVREAYSLYGKDAIQEKLSAMRCDGSLHASSQIFVEDFYARKYLGKRTSVYTDLLREPSRTLKIDEAYIGQVEEGVIHHYQSNGMQAFFTENHLWRVLFAFYFWELLYDKEQFSEFDRVPAPLRGGDFYTQHRQAIESALRQLDNKQACQFKFTKLATEHYGFPTGLFHWSAGLMDTLIPCIQHAPSGAIATILRRMAKHYKQCKDGYPDLMIIDGNQLRFEEIKAPGDNLRPNQLVSIQRLRNAGFEVQMSCVEWATNPEQIYAVVDIETTGGSKSGNAITEIAVVSVRNGKVVGEWSTLVNPQRHIPHHITQLTGIDNALVASAPTFSDIADELRAQLENSIFVAHNVNFDYGFIQAAYHALGQSFRKPKYCTVVNSRKAFPGLKSYSLGKLTEALDIDLSNHHRALADARATADLLRLIQTSKA